MNIQTNKNPDNLTPDNLNICKDLGKKTVPWQSTITANISLNRLKETEERMEQERWGNCGILSPHLEATDIQNSRKKVIKYLEQNSGKHHTNEQLISIKNIANELHLTEEFVLSILKEYGMDIVEE